MVGVFKSNKARRAFIANAIAITFVCFSGIRKLEFMVGYSGKPTVRFQFRFITKMDMTQILKFLYLSLYQHLKEHKKFMSDSAKIVEIKW